MDTLYPQSETGCCLRFNPEPWDGKELHWQNKRFIKDRVKSFLHIPLNFGKVMIRNIEKIKNADALPAEPVMLVDENSLWGADVYIAVAKDVPDAEMAAISGTFRTKVFEGPYKNIRSWVSQMKEYMSSIGKTMKKLYFFYTTCPRCAKYYGKNYVVLVAEV